MTMACWSYQPTAVALGAAITLHGSLDLYMDQRYLNLETVAGGVIGCWSNENSNWEGSTVSGYTADTWHHIGGVWDGNSSRTAYLNGSAGTTNTVTRTITSSTTIIGAYSGFGGYQGFWPGYLAEAAMWDAALTAAEMATMADGFSPLLVRPGNLVAYWPLYGRISTEPDYVGGFNMTLTGGDANADHPKIFKPPYHNIGVPTAVATKSLPIFSRAPLFLRRAA
mgnify:CR=1 FL=1